MFFDKGMMFSVRFHDDSHWSWVEVVDITKEEWCEFISLKFSNNEVVCLDMPYFKNHTTICSKNLEEGMVEMSQNKLLEIYDMVYKLHDPMFDNHNDDYNRGVQFVLSRLATILECDWAD